MPDSSGAYHRKVAIEFPNQFGRRKWGFFPFGRTMMVRQVAFRTGDELRDHLARSDPAHSFHSTGSVLSDFTY